MALTDLTGVTHRTVATNGLQMHIAEAGDAGAPAVIMLHGFPESWYSWRHQLGALAAAGFHAVAPDLRGYGQTGGPQESSAYTILHQVGDIVGLIHSLGTEPVVVVGHDWGAPLAWITALLRPDLVRGVAGLSVPYLPRGQTDTLTSLAATLGPDNYQAYFQTDAAQAELESDLTGFVRRFTFALSADNPHPSKMAVPSGGILSTMPDADELPAWLTEDDIAFYAGEFSRSGMRGPLNWYRASKPNHELMAAFDGMTLTAPALYIGGEQDPVVNWPLMRVLIGMMSTFVPKLTKAVLLDNCGHWTQQEQPKQVNDLLVEFIGGLGVGTGMPVLDRDGVAIHFDVSGSGPAILLTHGFGASSHMFASNVGPIAADHTVITWDMRGHGRSDYPADPTRYSPDLAVGDMLALIDVAGGERAVIGGHSLGGFLSLAFHLAHPARVRALILIDTGPGYRKDEGRATWNGMAERYARSLERDGLAGLPGSGELTADVHRDACGLVLAARGILTQRDAMVLESLPSIAVPTLVVVGEKDAPFLGGSQYMAGKIRGAELAIIEGADHAPNVSRPREFDQVVRRFLDGLER